MQPDTQKPRKYRGNIWVGLLFLLIGGLLLLRQSGYPLPHWIFSWQMLLIGLGVFVGIKNRFRDFSWLLLIFIGFIFLSDNIWPGYSVKQYMWPIIIIALGLMFIFAPKGSSTCRARRFQRRKMFRERMMARRGFPMNESNAVHAEPITEETDYDNTVETDLDIVSIFGGVKKKVLSKEFRGGEIVCVFGGAQINLSNADFTSPIELELVQIFGGTKLVVPANWEIRSEIAAIFGGVDDKRPQPANAVPEKTLILKGTIIFGGVEVNSF